MLCRPCDQDSQRVTIKSITRKGWKECISIKQGKLKGSTMGPDRCKCHLVWMDLPTYAHVSFFFFGICKPNRGCGGWDTQETWAAPRKASSFTAHILTLYVSASTVHLPEVVCSLLSACFGGDVKETRLIMARCCCHCLLPCLLRERWHPAGKDERLDYSQISKWAG